MPSAPSAPGGDRRRASAARTIGTSALAGVLFGVCFPIVSLAFMWWGGMWRPEWGGGGSGLSLAAVRDSLVAAHRAAPLLAVIDTAPLFLGMLATIAGVRRARIERLMARLRSEKEAAQAAECARAESEARFRAIFEYAALGIALHDGEGRVLEANPAFQEIAGYSLEELRGMRPGDLAPLVEGSPGQETALTLTEGAGGDPSRERVVRRSDGALRHCSLTTSRVESSDGTRGMLVMLQDVTEHRAAQEELAYRAYHDPLTGLANRVRFHERVAAALSQSGTPNDRRDDVVEDPDRVHMAVLLVDLDGFKLVNDTAGHAAGDALLTVVAERLLNATRGSDLVARLGGDEFGVLLTNIRGEADVTPVAERILATVARPAAVRGTTAVVGASVGIALGGQPAASSAEELPPTDLLLRNADLALYAAKARGRGRYVVFEPGLHTAAVERVELERAMRRGLEQGEFFLVYQPIVDIATGVLVGVEALARWDAPGQPTVMPRSFIPLAEETGLIEPLGRWVLEEACAQGAAWVAASSHSFSLTVNVSGRQLQQASFVDEVRSALATSGFPPTCLVLELTESSIVDQPEIARERLLALKELGVRIAIDDFGTGYSALSYLRQFPIDVLKIDKSFVDRVATGGQAAALAGAIVALGDALSLHTVAEGVESPQQVAALEEMGCSLAQGYHFSRPLGADTLTTWFEGGAGRPGSAWPAGEFAGHAEDDDPVTA